MMVSAILKDHAGPSNAAISLCRMPSDQIPVLAAIQIKWRHCKRLQCGSCITTLARSTELCPKCWSHRRDEVNIAGDKAPVS